MNFEQRLQKIIEECDTSCYKMAKDLGISQTTIKNYKNGTTKPNTLILEHLTNYLHINLHWLNTGEGPQYLKEVMPAIEKDTILRYYDLDVSAGPIEMFSPGNYVASRIVDIPGFNDCDIALNVWGDSMEPVLKIGQIVICKEWKETFIEYGYIYLIITKDDHRMIKYLKKSTSKTSVICESANKFYEPFEIEVAEILKLYLIKGHLERMAI